ncbi:MAG: ABC transporter transmembrane domain-containing protein, partial [Phenylobacterium sp.]
MRNVSLRRASAGLDMMMQLGRNHLPSFVLLSAPSIRAPMLKAYLRPESARMALLALFLAAGTGAQLASPMIVRQFIDTGVTGGADAQLGPLYWLASLMIGAAIAAQLLQIGATSHSEQLGWSTTNRIRGDLARQCLSLDMAFHTARSPGELIERV